MKIGVCLSAGGLPGIFAHIGFLKALNDVGLEYDTIIGTSAGSIISSYSATGMPLGDIERLALDLKIKDYLDIIPILVILWRVMHKGRGLWGLAEGMALSKFLKQTLPVNDFSLTKKPLYIHATNIDSMKEVIFNKGKISKAIRASSAIPIIYEPVIIDGHRHVDGGVTGRTAEEELARLENPDMIIVHAPESAGQQGNLEDSEWLPYHIVRRAMGATTKEIGELKFYKAKSNGARVVSLRPKISEPGVSFLSFDKDAAKRLIERNRKEAQRLLECVETLEYLGGIE